MGSDAWMFNEFVEEYAKRKIKEFNGVPTRAYISDNYYAARNVVKKLCPKIELIDVPSSYDKNDFRLE